MHWGHYMNPTFQASIAHDNSGDHKTQVILKIDAPAKLASAALAGALVGQTESFMHEAAHTDGSYTWDLPRMPAPTKWEFEATILIGNLPADATANVYIDVQRDGKSVEATDGFGPTGKPIVINKDDASGFRPVAIGSVSANGNSNYSFFVTFS